MANKTVDSKQLRLVFQTGVNDKGEPLEKRKAFNNIEISATVDQLYATAQAIASLQTFPLLKVEQQEISDIQE
ncbi:DUF1659 domain-containing protein [Bacillus sp. AGMB 02131]|uniref:DUF1659 domain-containing protein n=1 Tax=Peribacillus faecalis TaxID=2772559 RepID=A0A927CT43_9BACI|nr:DUF1659 domain-containing protein [Peribacillus faecalis]MBD3106951.1 DUF1659 domain-containing protein [Peribacillus faecalis]